ncbi:eIF-5a domain-containing protein [Rhizoctonia solani AG-1 IA]|uniref:RNA polymerase II degradation factor 1 n=1 Tax=Thanatephorus cucumeris (strain AG1-IA) TaxID=983506 RepID=L8WP29_THACA|nr:eIF-5a domain-containing protein [Rhizoctonia solani AG-1 IA]
MDVPNVTRTEFQLVNIDDGFLNLMSNEGVPKDDVRVPEGDLGKQIQSDFEEGKELIVTVCAAMNEEHALGVKEAPKGACKSIADAIKLDSNCWTEMVLAGTDACGLNARQQERHGLRVNMNLKWMRGEADISRAQSKKYGAQVKAIQEVFPDWHDDDLVSLLQDTHGSVETAIERITQGARN